MLVILWLAPPGAYPKDKAVSVEQHLPEVCVSTMVIKVQQHFKAE